MLGKLFGRGKREPERPEPQVFFGRYSDNNKPVGKISRWTDADNLFKEKKYVESLDAFFDYIRDDVEQNVLYQRNGAEGRFEIFQGSKIVRGQFDQSRMQAEVTLARMPQPSAPVMRRLLELNFSLYYSRFALDNDRLCMRFDSDLQGAAPSKMYYGLKELSTKADKQDDILVQDFAVLEKMDSDHVYDIPLAEKEVKYTFFQKWIRETLDAINSVDLEKFAGGISYMLLSLIYRIDYLLTPEGKLLREMESTAAGYFRNDERTVVTKNREMIESVKKMQALSKEELFTYLFRSKYTFSIVAPENHKVVVDSVSAANQNMLWYRDNGKPFIANQVTEYGISFCQYSYSLPRMLTEYFHLYMRVNYGDFFTALGYKTVYYDVNRNAFNPDAIIGEIAAIGKRWKEKYPLARFDYNRLSFDNLVNFNQGFVTEIANLNLNA